MYHYRAKYRSNYDGDTIRFDIDLGCKVWLFNEPVRLLGVNTPEMRGETLERARLAKKYVEKRLSEATTIEIKTQRDKKGKYGRWLAEVIVDGESLADELLLMKLAVPY